MFEQAGQGPAVQPGDPITLILSKFARALYPREVDELVERFETDYQLELRDPLEFDRPDLIFDEPLRRETRLLVVVGGDGTLNRVLNWKEGNCPVLIVPSGTANDLARNLAVPLGFREAASLLTTGRPRRLDTITVNGARFCTAGGLGLPADCALQVSKFRQSSIHRVRSVDRLGSYSYRLASLLTILTSPLQQIGINLRLETEERCREFSLNTTGVLIANQGRIAGELVFSPLSRDDDGYFEVALFHSNRRRDLLRMLQP